MIPTIIAVAVVSFFLIELPPGDYLSMHMARLALTGE